MAQIQHPEPPHWSAHPLAGPKQIYRRSSMDPKQRFYRHFLDTVDVLQDQITRLESVSVVGGERQDATDHILAGITKLQNEVADAAEYTPSYDRRQYSESIKSLQDKLNETVAKIKPKSRFQFKRSAKTSHVDMGAPENDPRFNPGSQSRHPQVPIEATTTPSRIEPDTVGSAAASNDSAAVDDNDERGDAVADLPRIPAVKNYNEEMARPSDSQLRKPSFSAARHIGISNQTGLHIILPSSAARATAAGSLTDLAACVVDMSVPTAAAQGGAAFPGLALKNIARSLIVAGRVAGPTHITNVSDSILVVTARQVRIHECRNVDIYLHCASHPIIEDCTGMRFAPLPASYMTEVETSSENQWNQVDDFKWLKAGHSPNWTTLSDAEMLPAEVWQKVVPGQPGVSVEETLSKVGIPKR